MNQAEYTDKALVEVYDAQNVWSQDDEFFMALLASTPASSVLDLGCGTGRLTTALARAGHQVTGVDPAQASLDAAQAKAGAAQVTWRCGGAYQLPPATVDLALMTSHVAQVFLTDQEWAATLSQLRGALKPGGRLAFDMRDPAARAWERWTPEQTRTHLTLPSGRGVSVWSEVTEVRGQTVSLRHHYTFTNPVEEKQASLQLRFQPEVALRFSLERAGFLVEAVYGGWQKQAVGQGNGELIVVAQRTP